MEKIASPRRTQEIVTKYNISFQKKYGQNFLVDLNILDNIVEAAQICKDDLVIEIGPGIGSLTQYLAEAAKEVIAIEIDKKLIPILEETLSEYENVTIINDDILKVNVNEMISNKNMPVKIVANLPYYITTPIIMGIFENDICVDSITVMIQKEVADRMQAKPSTKDYGALSLAVQYYSIPKIVANVPSSCFIPRPNVGSAVIRLLRHKINPIKVDNEKLMFKIIKAAFSQRRKTMVNSVGGAGLDGIGKNEVVTTLDKMNLSPTIRGEALSIEQFAEFTNIIMKTE
jgi:16S rRNA (adenine1518-N6/adenine1519-N6)-dimethyltransferase